MNLRMIRFITSLFLLSSLGAQAQSFSIAEQRQSFHKPHVRADYTFAKNNTNEIQYLFSGLFLFYKFAMSSQDNNKCSFSPSCSEYGMLAIKKKGPLIGMLATFDRLHRCNGLSPQKYTFDPEKNLLIDNP